MCKNSNLTINMRSQDSSSIQIAVFDSSQLCSAVCAIKEAARFNQCLFFGDSRVRNMFRHFGDVIKYFTGNKTELKLHKNQTLHSKSGIKVVSYKAKKLLKNHYHDYVINKFLLEVCLCIMHYLRFWKNNFVCKSTILESSLGSLPRESLRS